MKCRACGGAQTIGDRLCARCEGTGVGECDRCDGTGVLRDNLGRDTGSNCDECGGTGGMATSLERELRAEIRELQQDNERLTDIIARKAWLEDVDGTPKSLGDSARLDWLEAWPSLHRKTEIHYIVDGYEVDLMDHDGDEEILAVSGATLREAIDKART